MQGGRDKGGRHVGRYTCRESEMQGGRHVVREICTKGEMQGGRHVGRETCKEVEMHAEIDRCREGEM